MSHKIYYSRVRGEVCVGPVNDRPGNVGLTMMVRRDRLTSGGGWLEFTPAEARDLAAYLIRAAAEAEATSRQAAPDDGSEVGPEFDPREPLMPPRRTP